MYTDNPSHWERTVALIESGEIIVKAKVNITKLRGADRTFVLALIDLMDQYEEDEKAQV